MTVQGSGTDEKVGKPAGARWRLQDAVVIVATETYDREREHRTGRRLVNALEASPLRDIELERPFVTGSVREVEV